MSEQPYIYRYVDVQIAIATATEQERERIVKLIEDSNEIPFDDETDDWDVDSIPRLFTSVQAFDIDIDGFRKRMIAIIKEEGWPIALIKGETE